VASPHAPSGRLEPLERLTALARRLHGHAVLLLDEAYVDFATRDALPLVRASSGLDNVLLLRSLSKGYSLAGLRFGYGIGHRDLIALLNKARDSYNTDAVSQTAATCALQHRDAAAQTWRAVIGQRQRVTVELTKRGFTVLPSESNFVLVTPPSAPRCPQADQLAQKLKQKGVYVRYFDRKRLRDKLRITIGTPEQNDALLKAVDELMDQ
jgi:histidinol-phosphate aminotransferase